MTNLLILSIFILSTTITIAQKINQDTLFSISPKVFIYTSKETKSDSSYELALDYDAVFHYNHIYIKTKKTKNYCHAYYSRSTKRDQDKYQRKIKQGISIEKADSFILYKLTKYAGSYHTGDFFTSWGGYEEIAKFDKLQGKYHYMDFHSAYKKKQRIYRKNDWKRDKKDSIIVHKCTIERYLLVDSVIYLFTSSLKKNHRNRKRGLRILEREFKQFVRCIWVKEEEDVLEK